VLKCRLTAIGTVLFRGTVSTLGTLVLESRNCADFELLKAKQHSIAQFKHAACFERLPSTVYTMTKPIIIIEGNIGAGKSTLSKQLAASMRYALFQEPTTGNPYLEKYYSQPKIYALP
jgi:pantothenate kinase-related protein Tda10